MEYFSYTDIFNDPSVWTSIAFALIVYVIAKLLVPIITKSLDARGDAIAEEIDRAIALREEAEKTLALYQKKQEEALNEAESIIHNANLEARRLTKEAENKAQFIIEKRLQACDDKLSLMERQAEHEIREKIVDLATIASREIIAKQMDASLHNSFVKQACETIETQLQ